MNRLTDECQSVLLSNVVSVFIAVYWNCLQAQRQAAAGTGHLHCVFFGRTTISEISAAANHFAPSENFHHSPRTETLRTAVFKPENVAGLHPQTAAAGFAGQYSHFKGPILNHPLFHAHPSGIILSDIHPQSNTKRQKYSDCPQNKDLDGLNQWPSRSSALKNVPPETKGRIGAATTAACDSVALSAEAIASGSAGAAATGCKLSLPSQRDRNLLQAAPAKQRP